VCFVWMGCHANDICLAEQMEGASNMIHYIRHAEILALCEYPFHL
jgi:hypothetical protein